MRDLDLVSMQWRLDRSLSSTEIHRVAIIIQSLGAKLYKPSMIDYSERVKIYPYLLHRPIDRGEKYIFLLCTDEVKAETITYEELMYNIQKMIDNEDRFI